MYGTCHETVLLLIWNRRFLGLLSAYTRIQCKLQNFFFWMVSLNCLTCVTTICWGERIQGLKRYDFMWYRYNDLYHMQEIHQVQVPHLLLSCLLDIEHVSAIEHHEHVWLPFDFQSEWAVLQSRFHIAQFQDSVLLAHLWALPWEKWILQALQKNIRYLQKNTGLLYTWSNNINQHGSESIGQPILIIVGT